MRVHEPSLSSFCFSGLQLYVCGDSSPAETKAAAGLAVWPQNRAPERDEEPDSRRRGRERSPPDCFLADLSLTMTRLCSTHVLDHYAITNVDSCFKMVGRAFDGNEKVIEAARVGDGYEDQLKEIMNNELLSIVEDIDKKLNTETDYEERLQTAADNFIAAASKLPRASECFPPCGFQGKNAVYNCVTCKYDSCEFPLDCPVKEMQVEENNRTRMMCDVPFRLPKNVEVVWRFAEEVKTQKVTLFEDVTTGVDVLYSIPATSLQHTGTYQCEIYSDGRSIVRLYFYLTVTPQVAVGHTELQEVFDLCLLPGGQLLPGSDDGPPSIFHPTLVLLTVCFTSVLLVIHLSLGGLILSARKDRISFEEV